jgi:hypothetical protein
MRQLAMSITPVCIICNVTAFPPSQLIRCASCPFPDVQSLLLPPQSSNHAHLNGSSPALGTVRGARPCTHPTTTQVRSYKGDRRLLDCVPATLQWVAGSLSLQTAFWLRMVGARLD